MPAWFSRSLLIGGVFSLVWLVVVYTWRVNNRMPNAMDVALYFIACPIALLIVFWLICKAWGFATSPIALKNSAEVTESAAIAAGKAEDAERTAANERGLSVGIFATVIRSAHGSSAEELTANLTANEAQLDLDPELKNRDGFPVLSGRISEIDEDAQRDAFSSWCELQGRAKLDWSAEQLRAMSIAAEVTIELAQEIVQHPLFDPYISAIAKNHEVPLLPTLQLMIVLPKSWGAEHIQLMNDWVFDLIQQQGWPAEKISFRSVHNASPTCALAAIDLLMLDSYRMSQTCFALLLACDSHIGEATIEKWEDAGKLFVGKNSNAHIPGEAAAAILLGDETQAKLMALETNVILHRVGQSRRSKSIEAKGSAGDSILEQMIQDALAISKISAEKISLISSDTGPCSNRIVELMSVGFKVFPDLDPAEQYFKLTSNCGDIGAVASVVALALGHFQVINETAPALCISNMDPHERTVALLSPWGDAAVNSVTNT